MVLRAARERLASDPLAQARNLKTLRPNPVAQRELRLAGNYRVLVNVDPVARTATIVLVGEKRGASLVVQRQRFTGHESDPTK